MSIDTTMERLEKIKDFCEDLSIELSLFATQDNLNIKTVIKWFEKITAATGEILEELQQERDKYK